MSQQTLIDAVTNALSGVRHPASGRDIVSSGHVQQLEIDKDGLVRFAFHLKGDDPGSLVKSARTAAGGVRGVSGVRVNVQLPKSAPSRQPAPASSPAAAGSPAPPAAPSGSSRLVPGSVPAPTPQPGVLADTRYVVAVSSGKGGVGKSMVTTNLAAALARRRLRVGLLDADIYGPNIPVMFGEHRRPSVSGAKGKEMIEPLHAHGVKLMSLGFLLAEEQPAIMRGPLIAGVLKQFLEQVRWGALDVMLVDMPPGTGDAQLSLVQSVNLDGAVMVTTPQGVATTDVRRGIKMFERVNTRIIGVIENMSGMACPHCGEPVDVFGTGGGEALAKEQGVPFLGAVPLDPAVRRSGDDGLPTVVGRPDSAVAQALNRICDEVVVALREGPA
ncbi:MAG: Mrp/NBP35 family ATP-binding protein [Gammaproteobacteria bacterium]|nr:Mrp/NBP35 family ATP-binding protein [Gammaproteobacteria bacterium]